MPQGMLQPCQHHERLVVLSGSADRFSGCKTFGYAFVYTRGHWFKPRTRRTKLNYRLIYPFILAGSIAIPGICIRLAGLHLDPLIMAATSGMAILGASFILL